MKRRLALLAGLIGLAPLLVFAAPAPAHASPAPVPAGYTGTTPLPLPAPHAQIAASSGACIGAHWNFQSVYSGHRLGIDGYQSAQPWSDIHGGSTGAGDATVVCQVDAGFGNYYYEWKEVGTNLCATEDHVDGDIVHFITCVSRPSQAWELFDQLSTYNWGGMTNGYTENGAFLYMMDDDINQTPFCDAPYGTYRWYCPVEDVQTWPDPGPGDYGAWTDFYLIFL